MQTVGERIYEWRRRRRISQEGLAREAGLSQSYISHIEAGRKSVDRISTYTALAHALQVSVAELMGVGVSGYPARDRAAVAVPAIREALVMREVGERGDPPPADAVRQVRELGSAADYSALALRLPVLLRGAVGWPLVNVCYEAMFALRYLGYPDLARDAARLGVVTAQGLDEPAYLGMAEFVHAHALPPETAQIAAVVAARAADVMPAGGDRRVREARGMLHLTAALRLAADGQPGEAKRHLGEAADEASQLGDPEGRGFGWMCFGPTNVGAWRMAVGNELGDPDETLRAAEVTQWRTLPTARRQAAFHIDHGRALAAVGGRDVEAVRAFLRAEELAPQYVRLEVCVRESVAAIRQRALDAALNQPLRRLAAAFDIV